MTTIGRAMQPDEVIAEIERERALPEKQRASGARDDDLNVLERYVRVLGAAIEPAETDEAATLLVRVIQELGLDLHSHVALKAARLANERRAGAAGR